MPGISNQPSLTFLSQRCRTDAWREFNTMPMITQRINNERKHLNQECSILQVFLCYIVLGKPMRINQCWESLKSFEGNSSFKYLRMSIDIQENVSSCVLWVWFAACFLLEKIDTIDTAPWRSLSCPFLEGFYVAALYVVWLECLREAKYLNCCSDLCCLNYIQCPDFFT